MRLKIIHLIIIVLFLLILCGLFFVQIIRGGYYYDLSINNRIRVIPLEGVRGKILDRNGLRLADNQVSYNVIVSPQDIEDVQKLFQFLSGVLGDNPQELIETYRRKKVSAFVPVVAVEDIDRDKAIIIEENRYRFPSVYIQQGYKRIYPLKQNSCHVVGYVGKGDRLTQNRFKEYGYSAQSIVGYLGAEEYYDGYLKGREGGQQIEVDSRGRQVRLLNLKEPYNGQDITLTIDSALQDILIKLLNNKSGTIVVMDSDTGEILGMTSSPAYDPNTKKTTGRQAPFLNRAIQGQYPPGSVFKVLMAMAGLDSKKITASTTFHCPGYKELGGIKFGCTHVHGTQNLIESLAHSCNVYYYNLSLILGSDLIHHYAQMFGFGSHTFIDLPYEKTGWVPYRRQRLMAGKKWYTGETLNLSIGQGDLLATPIQLVRMMTIVANEGIDVQPHIIKAIGGKDMSRYPYKHKININKKYFQTVNKGLRATVADYSGTAHVLDLKELYVAGKTGTAQSGGEREPHSWFVGTASGDRRRITFCVFLEKGGSSANACFLAREMLLQLKEEQFL